MQLLFYLLPKSLWSHAEHVIISWNILLTELRTMLTPAIQLHTTFHSGLFHRQHSDPVNLAAHLESVSSRVSFIEGSFPNLDIKSWGSVLSRTSDHSVSAWTSLEGEGWKPEGQLTLRAPVYHTWQGIWRMGRGRLFPSFQGCLLFCFLLVLISVFCLILFLSNIISPSFFSFNYIFAYLLHFVLQKDTGLASYIISWNHNSSLMMAFLPKVSWWWTSQWEINISQFHV